MLEAIAVPVLLKAVDWLFGEGSRILEDRRVRRRVKEETTRAEPSTLGSEAIGKPPLTSVNPAAIIQTKADALKQQIAETKWQESELHIQHLLSLLEIHTRNYRLAKEKYAKWGSSLVPPIVLNDLTESENAIAETTKELQAAVSKVYGKKVTTPELEQA